MSATRPLAVAINTLSAVADGNVTYFRNLLPMLNARPELRLTIYGRPSILATIDVPRAICVEAEPPHGGGVRLAYEQLYYPVALARRPVDLFYAPADNAPLTLRVPTVVAFRNLNIYDAVTQWGAKERARLLTLRLLAKASAKRLRRAIFVSDASRAVAQPALGLADWRCHTIHHGLGPLFRSALTRPLGERVPATGYWFTAATVHRHKNLMVLIDALSLLGERGPRELWIAGELADAPYVEALRKRVAELRLGERVRFLGPVRYPDIAAYYHHAAAFLFPSLRETFGHPIVEALAAGIPIVASNTPVNRELLQDAGLFATTQDPQEWTNMMLSTLDQPTSQRLRESSRARSAFFSWERVAAQMSDVFHEAMSS